jgi:hypothetical protein
MRAEDAELGHARDQLLRELLARVAGLEERQRLALDEAPHRRADHPLLVGEQVLDAVVVEIAAGHGVPPAGRCNAPERAI